MTRALVLALLLTASLPLPAATLVPIDVPPLAGADINQQFGTGPAKAFCRKRRSTVRGRRSMLSAPRILTANRFPI